MLGMQLCRLFHEPEPQLSHSMCCAGDHGYSGQSGKTRVCHWDQILLDLSGRVMCDPGWT